MLRNKEVKCYILYALHGSSMFRSLLRSRSTCSRFQMGVTDTKQGLTYFYYMKTVYPCHIPLLPLLIIDNFWVHGFITLWPNPKIWKCLIHIINNNICPLGGRFSLSESKTTLKRLFENMRDNISKKLLIVYIRIYTCNN